MNTGLGRLALVTAVVVAALLVALWTRDDGTPAERGQALTAGLAEALNEATVLRLAGADGTLTLERADGEWSVAEWGGYPARFEPVKEVLVGLSGLEVVEAMTARPDRHGRLGLAEPGAAEGAGTRLTVEAADGRVLADVIVGSPRAGQLEQLYARRAGEDQTWLVAGRLDPPDGAGDLVDRELLRLPATAMRAVTVEPVEGPTVRAERDGDAWILAEVPEGREPAPGTTLTSLAGALAYLDLEAVVPEADLPAELAWSTTTWRREDGLEVQARVARTDDQAFLRLAARQTDPLLPPAPGDDPVAGADLLAGAAAEADLETTVVEDDPTPDDSTTDASATDDAATDDAAAAAAERARAEEQARAAAAATVAELARLEGWTFRISTWKADALTTSLEDLLAPLPEPEPEPEPTAPADVDAPAPTDADAPTDAAPPTGDGVDDAPADAAPPPGDGAAADDPDPDAQAAASFDALHEAGLIGTGDIGPGGGER